MVMVVELVVLRIIIIIIINSNNNNNNNNNITTPLGRIARGVTAVVITMVVIMMPDLLTPATDVVGAVGTISTLTVRPLKAGDPPRWVPQDLQVPHRREDRSPIDHHRCCISEAQQLRMRCRKALITVGAEVQHLSKFLPCSPTLVGPNRLRNRPSLPPPLRLLSNSNSSGPNSIHPTRCCNIRARGLSWVARLRHQG